MQCWKKPNLFLDSVAIVPQPCLPNGSDQGNPACAYILWFISNLVTFIIIAVLVFFVCFVLCCARCCCKGKKGTNKQGCTGGIYPTRRYHKLEGVGCIGILIVWMIVLFAFTVLGASIWDVRFLPFPPSAKHF